MAALTQAQRDKKNAAARARYAANLEAGRAKRKKRYHEGNARRILDTGENDYKGRRKANEAKLAEREGFKDFAQRRRLKRSYSNPLDLAAARDREVLAAFGISKGQLLALRMQNVRHSYPSSDLVSKAQREIEDEFGNKKLDVDFAMKYIDIQTYRLDIDARLDTKLGYQDVGYVISYHAAVVNPSKNYDSLAPSKKTASGKAGNVSQYYYLVQYARIYDSSTYEERYGATSARLARGLDKVTP